MSARTYRIRGVHVAERPIVLRLPFRFGDTLVERTAEAYVRVALDGPDGLCHGVSAQLMVPRWFDKRPDRSNEQTVEDLRDTLRTAARAAVGLTGTVAELAQALRAAVIADLPALPRLAAGFGPAVLEMALIDAACRDARLPFTEAARHDAFGLIPLCPPDLDPQALAARLAALALPPRIALRHTVGYDAPLTVSEVAHRPDDQPVALDEVIAATGIRWFKLKLKGCPEADAARLEAIAAVLAPLPAYGATLDANEQYTPDRLAAFLARFRDTPALARLRAGTLFVEQPFPRETALDTPAPEGLPAVIDESDDTDDAWPRARARGYAGVSVKSCKGVLRALLNAARVAADPGAILTAEDLTCQPGLCWQQDTAMAASVGAAHVERNGHHFAGGMQGAPDAEKSAFLKAHPDLYAPGPRLRIAGGHVALASLDRPGFASDPGPDFATMRPLTSQGDTAP